MNLYQVKTEYLSVLDKLNSIEDLTPEIIQDTLAPYKDNVEAVALISSANVLNLKMMLSMLKEYKKRIDARIKRTNKNIESLKKNTKEVMEAASFTRISCPEFTASIVNSPKPSVDIIDAGMIPEKYKNISITINRELIESDIKNGIDVPGATLKYSTYLKIA